MCKICFLRFRSRRHLVLHSYQHREETGEVFILKVDYHHHWLSFKNLLLFTLHWTLRACKLSKWHYLLKHFQYESACGCAQCLDGSVRGVHYFWHDIEHGGTSIFSSSSSEDMTESNNDVTSNDDTLAEENITYCSTQTEILKKCSETLCDRIFGTYEFCHLTVHVSSDHDW